MTLRTLAAAIVVWLFSALGAYAGESGADKPFTVEYYYKIKWGHADEWMELYQKNHWPIMVAEMKDGHILEIKVHRPHNGWPEPYRWDVRVTITYKNVLVAHGLGDANREPLIARLYPDRDALEREERRRFELLEGLWDAELESVATDDWPAGGKK